MDSATKNALNQNHVPYSSHTDQMLSTISVKDDRPGLISYMRSSVVWRVSVWIGARALLLLCGLIAALIIAEVVLNLYNPFSWRLRGNKIILQTDEVKVVRNEEQIPNLDSVIVHTRNSLGFRGANPPADLSKSLSIVTVGGSTTECYYLSDNKTWPALLGERLASSFDRFWINIGGLDGPQPTGI